MIRKLFFKIPNIKSARVSFGLLILRVSAGVSMAFAHGLGKVPPSEGFTKGVGEMGFFMPSFFAWAAGLSEFVGGLLVAIGLFTRPSAFFVSLTMMAAFFIRHADDDFSRKEKALLYLVIFIVLYITGPGKYSIDQSLNKRLS